MVDSEGRRAPGAKNLKQSSLLGLFSQSTECAIEPESESSDIESKQAKQFLMIMYLRRDFRHC